MFLVFNKEKIYTYCVSIITVMILFAVANNINIKNNETEQTSANISKALPIYKVKTNEKKVSLTMNCAWNADDIDKILEILENKNIKITFFMVGDWVDKFPQYVEKITEKGHEIRKS